MTEPDRKPRGGFTYMTPEQRSRISAMGGRACQALGKAHRFIEGSDKAKEAGRKGGRVRQSHSRTEPTDGR